MTSKDVAALYARSGHVPPSDIAAPDASKYKARKKLLDGHTFDSTAEADAYVLLKFWERSKIIADLELQPAFLLQEKFVVASVDTPRKTHRSIKYIADFRFRHVDSGKIVVADVKGMQTPVFKIKLKMFRQKFPDVDLQIWDRAKVKEMSR